MNLYVNQRFDDLTIDVWFVDEQSNTDVFYTTHSDDPAFQGIMRHESDTFIRSGGVKDATGRIKPFMKMSTRLFDVFLKLMVEYASKQHIVTENENLIQGKIIAQDKHLADMRSIAFKLLEIEPNKEKEEKK